MATSIGSLELEIRDNSQKAIKGLDELSSSLSRLKNVVSDISGLSKVSKQLSDIGNALSKLPNSSAKLEGLAKGLNALSGVSKLQVNKSTANQISALASAANGIDSASMEKLENLGKALTPLGNLKKANLTTYINQLSKLPDVVKQFDNLNLTKFISQLRQLTSAFAPFGSTLNSVKSGLSGLPKSMDSVSSASVRMNESLNKSTKSSANLGLSSVALKAKLLGIVYAAKKVYDGLVSAFNASADYVENMNLFNVAMGNMLSKLGNMRKKSKTSWELIWGNGQGHRAFL